MNPSQQLLLNLLNTGSADYQYTGTGSAKFPETYLGIRFKDDSSFNLTNQDDPNAYYIEANPVITSDPIFITTTVTHSAGVYNLILGSYRYGTDGSSNMTNTVGLFDEDNTYGLRLDYKNRTISVIDSDLNSTTIPLVENTEDPWTYVFVLYIDFDNGKGWLWSAALSDFLHNSDSLDPNPPNPETGDNPLFTFDPIKFQNLYPGGIVQRQGFDYIVFYRADPLWFSGALDYGTVWDPRIEGASAPVIFRPALDVQYFPKGGIYIPEDFLGNEWFPRDPIESGFDINQNVAVCTQGADWQTGLLTKKEDVSGKIVIEVTVSFNPEDFVAIFINGDNSYFWFESGYIEYWGQADNNVEAPGSPNLQSGDKVTLYFDTTSGKVWIAINEVLIQGDPATDTDPYISDMGYWVQNPSTGENIPQNPGVLNQFYIRLDTGSETSGQTFTLSRTAYSVPTGWQDWDPPREGVSALVTFDHVYVVLPTGGALLDGAATVLRALSYSFMGSGTALVSGASSSFKIAVYKPSGHVDLSGSALQKILLDVKGNGDINVEGEASLRLAITFEAEGAVVLNGDATYNVVNKFGSSGLIDLGGEAVVETLFPKDYTFQGSGFATVSGNAPQKAIFEIRPTGEINSNGQAVYTLVRDVKASGGTVLAGHALANIAWHIVGESGIDISGGGILHVEYTPPATGLIESGGEANTSYFHFTFISEERTISVVAELRLVQVDAIIRSIDVPAQNRTIDAVEQDRILTAPETA